MDRGKRPSKITGSMSNKIYMDLREIIKERALPFLPAKSLFRFTGVCRDWKLQISAPFFAHTQTNSFHAISGIFCQFPRELPSFISLEQKAYGVPDPSLKFFPEEVDVRTSSNGLLCCQGRSGDKAYYICNPVTKQLKKLPQPNANHGPDPAIVLIFEPSRLNFVADYKLVCAFPSADFDDGYEFEIYSSEKGSWENSGEIFFGNNKFLPASGIHVNDVVYWQVKQTGLVAFDVVKCRAKLIQSYAAKGTLGVMHKKLCATHIHGKTLTVSLLSNIYSNTMQLHSHARAWEEKCRIQLDDSLPLHDQPCVLLTADNLVVIQARKTIFSFDTKTREGTILCNTADSGMRSVPYVNSLVYV
ncbi:putative F-box protein At3g23950 [Malania oleifera]|uniref:putative F-box protein At3g23950 n=1 Tax=Malania oleifera TaxID=397392 RepID=UPI0025AE9A8E|nr:putative F-box protein At3g23950 [Malania oleifera]XP_057973933.1 putative F-box protein At3g23950 [Malania oleifera]XP_057973941.1 putative F-box protein At3g23950 [Malania oleifera]XP_057973950.1 putative F-box protein At3g23950 [Malania oleifera]